MNVLQETEANINKRDISQNYVMEKIQEILPSEDNSSPVLTPLYPFQSATSFSMSDSPREEDNIDISVAINPEKTKSHSTELPEQYKRVAFAKSVREKFAEKVPIENNVDYVERILLAEVSNSKQREQSYTIVKKSRDETIRKFLSYKKGIRVTCEICGESFADKKSLLRHKVCRHEKFSPHQCPICKKMFYKPGDVRRHMVIHTESRDFCCQFCEKSYKTNNHLQRHLKTKHKDEVNTNDVQKNTEDEDGGNLRIQDLTVPDVAAAVDTEKVQTESNLLAETIHGMNDRNDPVLEPIGANSILLPDTSTMLNSTAALLNSASAILQNHTNLNDQFFSRPDVQMCLMDRGFF